MANDRRYSEREVRAILERATQQEHSEGGLSHEDLLAAAREAGISTDAVEKAAVELEGLQARDAARERILARRRSGFYSHLWAFIGVQVFLLALNLLTTPDYLWFLFPLLGWGLGLFFSARHGFSKTVSDHAISREMVRSRVVSTATRVANAIARPSPKRRAHAPARVSETALEQDFDAEPEVSAPGDVTLPEAGRQRK